MNLCPCGRQTLTDRCLHAAALRLPCRVGAGNRSSSRMATVRRLHALRLRAAAMLPLFDGRRYDRG